MSRVPIPSEARRGARCPLCGKPEDAVHKPFCSQGCKDRDLLNWLGDAYRVPGPAADDDELPTFSDEGDD